MHAECDVRQSVLVGAYLWMPYMHAYVCVFVCVGVCKIYMCMYVWREWEKVCVGSCVALKMPASPKSSLAADAVLLVYHAFRSRCMHRKEIIMQCMPMLCSYTQYAVHSKFVQQSADIEK